ncbi:MAG: adenylosuccinate lyase [Armatimonadetes bacterium]|nr:adenylosuccinate lyase [Armatimonadota bacterium]
MIERYSRPEMQAVWAEEAKFQSWLEVELAICAAWRELGVIPAADYAKIENATLRIDVDRIHEIEAVVDHDLIAFVKSITEQMGDEGRHFHFGITSYDVEDTALALRMTRGLEIIREGTKGLRHTIWERARENKGTIMMGRTHGVHAEPVTLAFKLCVWLDDLDRALERLELALERAKVGKVSGAVGTYANVDPRVERLVCMRLGLRPAPVSTQIIPRDVHAEVMCVLALLAAQLERMATEVRNLQRTELLEVSEPFKKGQRGSSAMPHKRNPWRCETVSGLARVVRGNLTPALEDIITWHERDLTNSSVERVVLPDNFLLVDWMLHRFQSIVRGLQVHPENMQRNVELTQGVIYSQQVRLALSEAGLSYDDAYDIAQKYALQAWNERTPYRQLLEQDPQVREKLSAAQLDACFDPTHHLKHLTAIYERFGL